VIPRTADGRVLFCLPWLDSALIGTTDIQKEKPEVDPTVSFDEMVFLVKEIS
jgi:glycerol-3-phosphate dehydrogenase